MKILLDTCEFLWLISRLKARRKVGHKNCHEQAFSACEFSLPRLEKIDLKTAQQHLTKIINSNLTDCMRGRFLRNVYCQKNLNTTALRLRSATLKIDEHR